MDPGVDFLSLADVRRRSVVGFLALALRGGAGKLVTIVSTVILSRLLLPADFGAFAILQLPIGWLNLLADAGIAAALIQRPFLSPHDEQAGFMLRLLLAAALGVVLIIAAGLVGQLYDLAGETSNMLRLLALGPALGALGTIPGVRLNRELRFDRLALAEWGSLLVGQGTAVTLAWLGGGLWSLVAGSLATVLTGSLLVNFFAPWRPRLALPANISRDLLRFGLPYQGQGLVHLAKDQAIPALGGLFFSSARLGYLTWSQDVARWPRLPADYAARIAFPAFARLQQNPDELSRLLHNALSLVCWFGFGTAAVGMGLAPLLVGPVFGVAWTPAIPALIIFLAQTPLDALAAVLLPLIYATGQAGKGLRLSAMWLVLTWLFSLAALAGWGDWRLLPAAFGLATAVTLPLIIRHLPDGVQVRWKTAVIRPAAASLLLGILLKLVVRG